MKITESQLRKLVKETSSNEKARLVSEAIQSLGSAIWKLEEAGHYQAATIVDKCIQEVRRSVAGRRRDGQQSQNTVYQDYE